MKEKNQYGWYTAEYCRSTGLPMYTRKTYADVSDRYLSKTRCAKIKMPVKEGENPVAFYRVERGYCALYLRDERKTVVLDFDGVIHSYTSGWICDTVIPDPPVPGIREAIADIRKDYRVVVVSSRCSTEKGCAAIASWLSKYGIEVDDIAKEKPPAVCYVDDRAICFDGRADSLKEKIAAFQPWYQRSESIAEKTCVCTSCGIHLETFDAELPGECPHCRMKMKGEGS